LAVLDAGVPFIPPLLTSDPIAWQHTKSCFWSVIYRP
jgi:hypothetical protein